MKMIRFFPLAPPPDVMQQRLTGAGRRGGPYRVGRVESVVNFGEKIKINKRGPQCSSASPEA